METSCLSHTVTSSKYLLCGRRSAEKQQVTRYNISFLYTKASRELSTESARKHMQWLLRVISSYFVTFLFGTVDEKMTSSGWLTTSRVKKTLPLTICRWTILLLISQLRRPLLSQTC